MAANHRMEVGCPVAGGRVSVAQRHREDAVIPLEPLAGYVEVALRRIEVEVIVVDLPDSITSKATNEYHSIIIITEYAEHKCVYLLVGEHAVVQEIG